MTCSLMTHTQQKNQLKEGEGKMRVVRFDTEQGRSDDDQVLFDGGYSGLVDMGLLQHALSICPRISDGQSDHKYPWRM